LNFLCSRTCATETWPAHPAQLLLPNSPRYNRRLLFAASPSSSPRQKRSRITICGLRRPTPSTRRGRTLEGNPGRHATCRQAVAEPASIAPLLPCVCFCRTHVRSLLLLFLLICWTRVHLGLIAPHLRTVALHTIAKSARRRPAPLTPHPVAGPSRSSAPRASAFRRTP
jgi:hypothetical protein